jgi:hypothetical protein
MKTIQISVIALIVSLGNTALSRASDDYPERPQSAPAGGCIGTSLKDIGDAEIALVESPSPDLQAMVDAHMHPVTKVITTVDGQQEDLFASQFPADDAAGVESPTSAKSSPLGGKTPPKNPGTPLFRKISELQLGEKFVEIGTVSPTIRVKRNSIDILKDSEK